MDDFFIPSSTLSPAWLNFFILLGSLLAASLLALLWFAIFYKKKRKRKHRRRHERFPKNPSLAQTGGLPPVREEEPPES